MTERGAQRAALLAARIALPAADHARLSAAIDVHLETHFGGLAGTIGFYWPVRREFDAAPFVERRIAAGATAALPVVAGPRRALAFRRWQPGAAMVEGAYGIAEPADGEPVAVGAMLVPLVGFDARNFRLGYGGGYYDRTLAAPARPLTIGVGFELGRLSTIDPLPHDVPLDFVVTEAGVQPRPE